MKLNNKPLITLNSWSVFLFLGGMFSCFGIVYYNCAIDACSFLSMVNVTLIFTGVILLFGGGFYLKNYQLTSAQLETKKKVFKNLFFGLLFAVICSYGIFVYYYYFTTHLAHYTYAAYFHYIVWAIVYICTYFLLNTNYALTCMPLKRKPEPFMDPLTLGYIRFFFKALFVYIFVMFFIAIFLVGLTSLSTNQAYYTLIFLGLGILVVVLYFAKYSYIKVANFFSRLRDTETQLMTLKSSFVNFFKPTFGYRKFVLFFTKYFVWRPFSFSFLLVLASFRFLTISKVLLIWLIGMSVRYDQGYTISLVYFVSLSLTFICFLPSFQTWFNTIYGYRSLRLLGWNNPAAATPTIGRWAFRTTVFAGGFSAADQILLAPLATTVQNTVNQAHQDALTRRWLKLVLIDPVAAGPRPGLYQPIIVKSVLPKPWGIFK